MQQRAQRLDPDRRLNVVYQEVRVYEPYKGSERAKINLEGLALEKLSGYYVSRLAWNPGDVRRKIKKDLGADVLLLHIDEHQNLASYVPQFVHEGYAMFEDRKSVV